MLKLSLGRARRIGGLLLALGLGSAASGALAGCGGDARVRYPTTDNGLKLERVVLYRNGIGYFERAGEVDGDVLRIRVRKDQVNDLLKSLTVVEREGGKAVSVSMPLDPQSWANAALATLAPGRGNLAEVLDALRGTAVVLSTTEGSVKGRVVMVEELLDAPAPMPLARGGVMPPSPESTRDHRVTLLDGSDMRIVRLSNVRSIQLEDGDLAMQLHRTLDASAGEGMFQQVEIAIRLAGNSSHDLQVSYVVAAPMWKPTYRVVLPGEGKSTGKALLQAWAVVDNTSGEDWRDVQLGLTSGAPIAFRYDLHTPREVPRSDLTESGVRRQAQAMVGETSYGRDDMEPSPEEALAEAEEADGYAYAARDEMKKESPKAARQRASAAPAPPAKAPSPSMRGPSGGAVGYGRAATGMKSLEDKDASSGAVDFEALRRSTMAQARASTVSGQTRFDLDTQVTVPDGASTMVAIVNTEVDGEETFLFRPGGAGIGYESNPYRVVRFKNTTPFVLEPGPISIYAGGSFVGEGLSEIVGAGTSATIPFAVETGLMVSSTSKYDGDEMRLIKISRGVLEVEQFSRRTTTYTVKAQTMNDGFRMLVRHAKTGYNYELTPRPEGTEDLVEAYLVPITVEAGKREGSLTIVEQTPSKSSISIWDAPALGVMEKLLVATDLLPEAKKKLQPIVDKRREVAKIDERVDGLVRQRQQLDQRASETRANLLSIEKNQTAAALRAKLTKMLDDFASEGNRIGKEIVELETKRLEHRIELEDLLQNLELVAPSKPKK
jgi:hypothetical protein